MDGIIDSKGGGCDILQGIEIIVNTVREERDSEKLLSEICGKVLELLHCDRAWLLYPCDPESGSWQVPIERTVPAYPGASLQGLSIDMTPDVAEIFQTALDNNSPVVYGPGGFPLSENTKSFHVKSQLSMAVFPRVGKPWQFGVHQCSYDRVWKETEKKLFQIVGIMTAEALGNILLFRELQSANEKLEQNVKERTADLEKEKEFAESLIETAQAIVLVLEPDGNIVRFNRYMEELSGYCISEVKRKKWFEVFIREPDREKVRENFHSAISDAQALGDVNVLVAKDGSERFVAWYGKTLKDSNDRVVALLIIGHDVTERVKIENRIRTSLEEKEILLQEVHHRVKNNMQIITSLIGIQRSQMKGIVDPVELAAFVETENRIHSMALVHERLYRSADFAHVDLAEYTRQLTNKLFEAYKIRPDTVSLVTEIENIQININQAIPCGLIVNELLSNALKYAFPDGRKGRILVALHGREESVFELSVCDDGIGLPADFDVASAQTTGLLIVNALIGQLKGDLHVDRNRGTCYRIRFKDREIAQGHG